MVVGGSQEKKGVYFEIVSISISYPNPNPEDWCSDDNGPGLNGPN